MGTSPATAFKINQFSEDMSLDNVEVAGNDGRQQVYPEQLDFGSAEFWGRTQCC